MKTANLLALRARGGLFSRTLSPVKSGSQATWEYLNYALALLGLGLVYLIHRASRRATRRKYLELLGARGA